MTAKVADAGTAERILDVAERLLQRRGFNGFSYADIATELEVTKPALHYHYASKALLGQALIDRYAQRFFAELAGFDNSDLAPIAKLESYIQLYGEVLRNRRMCLCGMLAAEYQTLPSSMQVAVVEFFERNEVWLQAVIEQGTADGSVAPIGSARDSARLVISCLEGAVLIARPTADLAAVQAAAASLLASLAAAPRNDDSPLSRS